jgi:type II secretory pathway component PulC
MTAQRSLPVLTAALLGAICLGLAALVLRELNAVETSADAEKPVAARLVQPLPREKTFAMAPIEKFSAIVERPIFSPSRRPAATQSGSLKQQQRPRSKLALFGIAISAGERIALVGVERGTGRARMKEGQTFSGWTVVEIERNRVLLRQGTVDEELELNYEGPPPRK